MSREEHELPLRCLDAFADAVFAIAVTIVVLEISSARAGRSVADAAGDSSPLHGNPEHPVGRKR